MVTKSSYRELEQGDIIFVDLNPGRGHEQKGMRPCIVLTKKSPFLSYMRGVAPITSKAKKFPLHIPLPETMEIQGEILLEHHKMLDLEVRKIKYVETAPERVTNLAVNYLKLMY